jgi:hypothetical protein
MARLHALLCVSCLVACGSNGSSSDAGGGGDAAGDSSGDDGQSGDDAEHSSDAAASDGGGADAGAYDAGTSDAPPSDASQGPGVPPFGGTSGGSGGPASVQGDTETAGGITYRLIVPSSPAMPSPLLIVFSGTEGGAQMTQNLLGVGPSTGTDGFIEAVLDGVTYYGNGAAGATVLDDVRAKYDVDNDRTYLLGESAGTTAALQLGFHLRQSYFAAYWANDVNASDSPGENASQLLFAPWGQAGPGGDAADAQTIVSAMQAAGYRLPNPAPYNGPGSGTHGDPQQFIAAVSWFPGKTRK